MTGTTLRKLSDVRLSKVHADLIKVINLASEIHPIEFIVTEGLRTLNRQKKLLAAGASTTLRSRHLSGHAVDLAVLVDGKIRWDWPLYETLSVSVKSAAAKLEIPIEWGGDWKTLRDGSHYQLPWAQYPFHMEDEPTT